MAKDMPRNGPPPYHIDLQLIKLHTYKKPKGGPSHFEKIPLSVWEKPIVLIKSDFNLISFYFSI